jgi:hypothetical protein
MDFPRVAKRLLAATSFFALSSVGIAQAAPCLVSLANTNPDGVLSSATACDMAVPIGPGQSPAATQAGVNADNPGGLGLSWTFIDRDPGSDGIIEAAFAMTGTGSGTWLINKDLLSSNSFVVTMKGGSPLEQDFLWFLIDTSAGANTCSGAQLAAGWDLCGTWAMYGTNGDSKGISHMDLFGATQSGKTIQAVPEPSTSLLLAAGLLGVLSCRTRLRRQRA